MSERKKLYHGPAEGLPTLRQTIQEHEKPAIRCRRAAEDAGIAFPNLGELSFIVEKSPAIAFLRRAMDGCPVAFVSDNIAQFGYTPDDFTSGMVPYTHIIHPADRSRVAAEAAQYIAEGRKEFIQQYRIVTKSGEVRWIDDRSWVRRDGYGLVTHVQGIVLDITGCRQAEEARRESNERYRSFVENSFSGVYVIQNGIFVFLNTHAASFAGYTPEELIGRSSDSIVHPQDRKGVKEKAKRMLQGGDRSPYEFRMVTKNGDIRWIMETVTAIRHNGKRAVLGNSIDIIDRKAAEKALAHSECLYRAMFENTGNATVVIDEDVTVRLANTEFIKLSGYSKEEIEGKMPWTVFTHPEDQPVMLARHRLRRQEKANPLKRYEFRFVDRDGNVKDIALSVDMIPGTGKSIASLHDITDRKRAEETLHESQQRLLDILEFFPDATLIIDRDGKIIAWNRAMEIMTGMKKMDMLGRSHYEYAIPFYGRRRPILIDFVLHPETRKDYERGYKTILTNKDSLWGEVFVSGLPAGDLYLAATATVLRDSRGEIIAAIECIRDNTERKRMEDRLNRAEKMEALGTLAGGVAHDLNNVLGVMVGYSELMTEKLPEDSPLRKYAQSILQSSERGASIIEDLLTLARRGVSVSETVDLNEVIGDYLETPEYERLMSHYRDVAVRTELADGLNNIKGSPVHLGKTIMNLVANAVEAIDGSGEVTIRTKNCYLDGAINGYDHLKAGNYVVLSVSDTGRGIAAQDLGKIFEPFYTNKAMGRSGTGLGLSVVWGTVKDHNGYIDIHSQEGTGSTFTVYFPITTDQPSQTGEKSDISRYMGRGESILVIDDIEVQQELAENLLSKLNYRVKTVSGGEAAVAYLKDHKADLLLLDMIMGSGIDGLETFRKIREIEPHQKAVIVSGFAATERVRMAQELGAGEYVRKPYTLEKIGLAIRRELDREQDR